MRNEEWVRECIVHNSVLLGEGWTAENRMEKWKLEGRKFASLLINLHTKKIEFFSSHWRLARRWIELNACRGRWWTHFYHFFVFCPFFVIEIWKLLRVGGWGCFFASWFDKLTLSAASDLCWRIFSINRMRLNWCGYEEDEKMELVNMKN